MCSNPFIQATRNYLSLELANFAEKSQGESPLHRGREGGGLWLSVNTGRCLEVFKTTRCQIRRKKPPQFILCDIKRQVCKIARKGNPGKRRPDKEGIISNDLKITGRHFIKHRSIHSPAGSETNSSADDGWCGTENPPKNCGTRWQKTRRPVLWYYCNSWIFAGMNAAVGSEGTDPRAKHSNG